MIAARSNFEAPVIVITLFSLGLISTLFIGGSLIIRLILFIF